MGQKTTVGYHNKCVGCYSPLEDIWITIRLETKAPPYHVREFKAGRGLFRFWKTGYNGRLLYKLVSIDR